MIHLKLRRFTPEKMTQLPINCVNVFLERKVKINFIICATIFCIFVVYNKISKTHKLR